MTMNPDDDFLEPDPIDERHMIADVETMEAQDSDD